MSGFVFAIILGIAFSTVSGISYIFLRLNREV